MEPRLQRRYQTLVQEQAAVVSPVAAGPRGIAKDAQIAAATQAAYRFYCNPRVSLTQLSEPLLQQAREGLAESKSFALAMHDWCLLHFNDHASKLDRIPLSQSTDLGYKLQCALLVGDRKGDPIAPVYLGLEAADGVHSSVCDRIGQPLSQLDNLAPVMAHIQDLAWEKPVVHIIDAEADSVAHFRHWNADYLFVVRADPVNTALHEGQVRSLATIGEVLKPHLRFSRAVEYHGQAAQQFVAETTVTITRDAQLRRHGKKGPRTIIPGEPIPLRLVVSEVRDTQGNVLACWYLLTNVPCCAIAQTVALWYYWRWRIESYFKLLKGAGLQLEHWQQETAAALTRRLLVASMACVMVWRLARSESPQADQVRKILVRLSGRQMKRGKNAKPYTEPALLAGLWAFLAMLEIINQFDHHELRGMLHAIFPKPTPPPSTHKPPGDGLV
jgi:hypothetical protein